MATSAVFYQGVTWGSRPEEKVEGRRYTASSVAAADAAGRALLAEYQAVVITDRVGSLLMVVGR